MLRDAVVSRIAGRVGNPTPRETSGENPSERNAEAEARSARCTVDIGLLIEDRFSDLDALDRRAGLANLPAGPTPVGEDASAIAAHLAGDRTQSRHAPRPPALESGRAERTGGTAPATLHQSETDRTAELVPGVAETNPRTR